MGPRAGSSWRWSDGQLAGTAALGAADVSPNAVGGVTGLAGLGVGPRSHHVAVLK